MTSEQLGALQAPRGSEDRIHAEPSQWLPARMNDGNNCHENSFYRGLKSHLINHPLVRDQAGKWRVPSHPHLGGGSRSRLRFETHSLSRRTHIAVASR